MTKKERFSTDLGRIDRQISALQEYLYEAELYPEQDRPWGRLRRKVYLFLVRRYVFRQIQQLYLRRRMIQNCHQYVQKREPEDHPGKDTSLVQAYRLQTHPAPRPTYTNN